MYYILLPEDQIETLTTHVFMSTSVFGTSRMNFPRLYTECWHIFNSSTIVSYRTPCWWEDVYPPRSAIACVFVCVSLLVKKVSQATTELDALWLPIRWTDTFNSIASWLLWAHAYREIYLWLVLELSVSDWLNALIICVSKRCLLEGYSSQNNSKL